MTNEVKLEFSGFDPGLDIKRLALTASEKLELCSPSDSALKMAFKKGRGFIEASCRIASQAGEFAADVIHENPAAAIRELERKMSAQLEVWKQGRFI